VIGIRPDSNGRLVAGAKACLTGRKGMWWTRRRLASRLTGANMGIGTSCIKTVTPALHQRGNVA
jgi:hypothetical protein